MNRNPLSAEERLDSNYRIVAIAFLFVGLLSATGAFRFLAEDSGWAPTVISAIRWSALAIVPVLCLVIVWRAIAFKRQGSVDCRFVRDGFVFHSIRTAAIVAGLTTYLTLAVLDEFSEHAALPVKFYLRLAMAIMALTFSVTYLVASRVQADDEDLDVE